MTEIIFESSCCPICKVRDDKFLFSGKDELYFQPGLFNIVQCKKCGLLRTDPRPSIENIGSYYPDNYGPYQVSLNLRKISPDWFFVKILKICIKTIFEFNTNRLPKVSPGNLLEIGCSSGQFLTRMVRDGWAVRGVEFSEKIASVAKSQGHLVDIGSIGEIEYLDSHYDLIVGWMVLEHLHDPVDSLKKLRRAIKSDGWLVISIPNAKSIEFNLFQSKWYALQLPTHLFHFTKETLSLTLKASGWKLVKIHHHRIITNLVMSIALLLRSKGMLRLSNIIMRFNLIGSQIHYLLFPVGFILALFGQTGRMTVWIKPDNDF